MTDEHSQAADADNGPPDDPAPPESRRSWKLREAELVSELFASLTAGVIVEAAPPFADLDMLLPEERATVERSVEKRIREFATGRVLARKALARMGRTATAIPAGDDRAPIWPTGVIGTISHTSELCVVACALPTALSSPPSLHSIGLDVERLRPLKPGLTERILRPEERATQGERSTLTYFCAKEAVYKCQYTMTHRFLEFHDVHLELDDASQSFRATVLVQPDDSPWKDIQGRWALAQGHVFAAAAIQSP